MTRAIRDRILKDVNGDINDHLRSHIHLTNCIHLKNHMHKQSPILAGRALIRDLIALQKSRSLRDPSASPHGWHSPSIVDSLLKRSEKDEAITVRRSVGIERPRMSVSSLQQDSTEGERRQDRREEGSRSSESKDRSLKMKGSYRQDLHLRTLSEQLQDIPDESDHAGLSRNHEYRTRVEKVSEEDGINVLNQNNSNNNTNNNRAKRRRFRSSRRPRASINNEMSVASNSFAQGGNHDNIVNGGPCNNRCGIPWNWSRIHDRGKSILDLAGKSLSCGISELRSMKTGSNMPDMSQHSSSSSKSNCQEALPLLLDSSHDYSSELGLYAENLLKNETDSDLASEGRSGEQHKKYNDNGRHQHQNITQKYMPKTFKDLVGQSLVARALSNAITKKKVGLLYIFHGPHGTGKTSCARIFARALNCRSLERSKPCGLCSSCSKTRNVTEIGQVSNVDFASFIELLDEVAIHHRTRSEHRVLIFDECDTLSSDCWSAILKAIDRAPPRRVVFVLVCSSFEALPHVITTRCQKFFFPKLKDADVIYTLQWIASKEDLEIDKDALKLIASRSDGSLRDAEMTLEQLSLLGKRISLGLVQELVGLVSDEKLVDLLDLALSADTVNTVKNLRDIMESGIEPLALMSQLATVITDILAGSYDFMKEGSRMKFFRHNALSKEEMEKLRQALKTLSEAEKQLRVSNDRITWLTAALLQLAPEQNYVPPSSSDNSFHHSPLRKPRKSNAEKSNGIVINGNSETEEIWLQVLEKIPISTVKEFMYREGKLISVSYGTAPTVQLLFTSQLTKSKAENFRQYVLQAFESVLKSPVTIDIRCEPRTEIVELEASPRESSRDRGNIGNSSSQKISYLLGEGNQSLSIDRSKVSLAHVIQHAEIGSQQSNGWSRRKTVSIAEKLEQENLRLEPRSRRLLCWNPPKATRRKLSRLKIRTRKPQALMKYMSCGRCLSGGSPK
ncbi:Protein STICHEL-like 3 [Striga hermonthica]|uniref:Protein STICHEL-like 3 n=1 Tax=Striga hermonthica TaxID=68872 RepID=A0A9N7REW0_STRHE|nr:Protein STICHEL-like 3 [Striga hermonthica]